MIVKTEEDFLEQIDESLVQAAKVLDMADLADGLSEDEYESIFEGRHHCGTCQVRAVMETVWPSIEEYVEWLSAKKK